ncbi:MAG: twin-arginine translocation signal domain-containing protein [Faecalibacterium sp.]|nr:twin-arginine translocation signal domain-containing protein [Faecalibacterium sp.]
MRKISRRSFLTCAAAVSAAGLLAACGGSSSSVAAGASSAAGGASAPAAKVFNIGISQLAPHVALDAATQGFKDALTNEFGDRVKFNEQNAAGEIPTCTTIANSLVSAECDLILANATPALQALATATDEIPVLGTSVTEYGVALNIPDFDGLVGTNVSGTSDLAPLTEQAAMVKEWFPKAKTVGLLYCSAEANSQYQVDVVKAELEALGYTCTLYAFTDTNDLASVTEKAANNSDVIYVPTDNTVANNTGIIDNICRPAGVPIIAGEEGICSGCGVATLSISYYDLGVTTGEMAIKILKGEAKVEEMPIEYAPQFTKKYNETICKDLKLTVPAGYEAIQTK